MVVRIYISRVSGNMEIKKRQELIEQVLTSRKIEYEEIDISDGSHDEDKQFMWNNSQAQPGQRKPLPPQVFNDQLYCGDFEAFNDANECDELLQFLKLADQVNGADRGGAAAANDIADDNQSDEGIGDNEPSADEEQVSEDQGIDEGSIGDINDD